MSDAPTTIKFRGRQYRKVTAARRHWHVDRDVPHDHPQFGENTERATFEKQSQAESHFDNEVARYKSQGFTILPQKVSGNIKKEVLVTKNARLLTLHECTEDDDEPPEE